MQFIADALEMWPAFVLLAALVALAAAVHLATPKSRSRLSRTVPVIGAAVALGAAEIALRAIGYPVAADWLHVALDLVVAFTAVNLAVALVFDVLLRWIGVEVAPIVVELVLASGWLVAVAVVLTASGFDLTGIAAASTLAVAILTISLQATLGNVVGGVAIQFDRSLKRGDWLQLSDGREGRVRQVRWRHTVLETREGNLVLVPNATLLSMTVTVVGGARGAASPSRLDIPFVTPLHTPPERVIAAVERGLRRSPIPNVSETPAPDCICVDLGAKSQGLLTFYARVWVIDPMPARTTESVVRLRVHTALRRAGLMIGAPLAARTGEEGLVEQQKSLGIAARELLDAVHLFDCLTADEKEKLAPMLRYSPYCDGELLMRQGDAADWLYLLGEGEVAISRDGQAINALVAPNLFGELGLMTGEPRSATVSAVGAVVCYRLDKASFDQILRGRSGIDLALSEILAARRQASHTSAQMTGGPPDRQWWLTRIRAFFRL